MRKEIKAAIIVMMWCAIGALQAQVLPQNNTASLDSTSVKINHFVPLRNEKYAPKMKKLTDQYYKYDYIRTVLPGKIRSFYLVDTIHIRDYYILENKDNISFLIINPKKIGKKFSDIWKNFDFENPLSNSGCYLTDGAIGANFWTWDYYCGPVARSLMPFWPYSNSKRKLAYGYHLYGPYKGCEKVYKQNNDTIPSYEIPHIFAVFLIKGSVYNHYFIERVMDDEKDIPFNFPDENSYYTLLIPIYNEEQYEYYFDRMFHGIYD